MDKYNTGETKNEDKLSSAIGELQKWQIRLLIAICPIKIFATWTVLDIIFLAPKTVFFCTTLNSSDVMNSTCYSECESYAYVSEFENSIISEWDLICDRAWMANFAQTVLMLGVLVGSMFFGFIGDRFGRRPSLLATAMLLLCARIPVPFCTSYWLFTVDRFFLGAAVAGVMVITYVLVIETVGPSKRELINFFIHLSTAVGQTTLPILPYFLRTWDLLCLGLAVPNLILLVYFFAIPESPKWLISVGRLDEACRVMTTAAKMNKKPHENIMEVVKSIADETQQIAKSQQKRATYLDLIGKRCLRSKTLLSCLSWFILGIGYYGGNQYVGQNSPNSYLAISLAGALQIPGILSSAYFSKRYGRRPTIIAYSVIAAISNLLLVMPDEWFYVKLAAGSLSISCITAVFSVMYMFTSELFPTVARNMAIGASSTASRVGSMLAPFIAGLTNIAPWLPPTIFSVMPLIAAISCALLPETLGRKMADHI